MGTYLITGATGGIGAAVAALLRERGHDLILAGRAPDRLAKLGVDLGTGAHAKTQVMVRDHNGQPVRDAARTTQASIYTVVLDMAEPRRIEAALAEAALPPRLDGIVHSAGVIDIGAIAHQDADHWIDQLMVNLVAAAELTRLLLPALRAARGHVVFINSGSGLRSKPNWSAYAASKHGLRALADSLRDEEPALQVTSVYPSRAATEMQRKVAVQENTGYNPADYLDPQIVARVVVNALETPREATVTDVSVRK